MATTMDGLVVKDDCRFHVSYFVKFYMRLRLAAVPITIPGVWEIAPCEREVSVGNEIGLSF